MSRILTIACLALAAWTLAPAAGYAQCPMCKISMESNLENGGTAGKGLNKGILYLFATPYLIIGGIGYVWWRNRKSVAAEDAELAAELN